MTIQAIDDKIKDTSITLIKTGTAPSISGRSELTYDIAQSPDDLLLRIVKNSGTGKFNCGWVSLGQIQQCLETTDKPFSGSILKPLFVRQSVNTAGFIFALLKHLKLIEAEGKGYVRSTDRDNILDTLKKKPKGGKA